MQRSAVRICLPTEWQGRVNYKLLLETRGKEVCSDHLKYRLKPVMNNLDTCRRRHREISTRAEFAAVLVRQGGKITDALAPSNGCAAVLEWSQRCKVLLLY